MLFILSSSLNSINDRGKLFTHFLKASFSKLRPNVLKIKFLVFLSLLYMSLKIILSPYFLVNIKLLIFYPFFKFKILLHLDDFLKI